MARFIDWSPLRVAVGILKFHNISMVVTGEAAFAYYNALAFDYEDDKFPVCCCCLLAVSFFPPLPLSPSFRSG
jgi:hypothetical protein